MFCSKCGKSAATDAQFCASCGSKLAVSQQITTPKFEQAEQIQPGYTMPPMPPLPPQSSKSGLGLGITGLILGILALAYGFSDYGAIADGSYSYILAEEIGILAILSILGIVFGGISTAKKSAVGVWALVLSILALFFTFFLAQFS